MRRPLAVYLLLVLLLSLTSLTSVGKARGQETPIQQIGTYQVGYNVTLSDRFGLFESVEHRVSIKVTLSFFANASAPREISLEMLPTLRFVDVQGLSGDSSYELSEGQFGGTTISVKLDPNITSASLIVEGRLTDQSVLWRDTAEIPYVFINAPGLSRVSYVLYVPLSPIFAVDKVYSRFSPNLRVQTLSIDGGPVLAVDFVQESFGLVILYRSKAADPLFVTMPLLGAVSLMIVTRRYKWTALSRIEDLFRKTWNAISKKANHSTLFALFLTLSLAMIAISLAVGPSPSPKVYVFASEETSQTIGEWVKNSTNYVMLTSRQELSEFDTLANLATFDVTIVADFKPPDVKDLEPVDRIIVIDNLTPVSLISESQQLYGTRVKVADNIRQAMRILNDTPLRANTFGFSVSREVFSTSVAVVGILSFALAFAGLAFLSNTLVRMGESKGGSVLIYGITYPILVFFVAQIVYVASSVLLSLPVGLHAGGGEVTAAGALGFGGGTRPRLMAGLLGFLFGALVAPKGAARINRAGLILASLLLIFLVLDPLFGGVIFHEFVLLFSTGPGIDEATITQGTIKGFLSQVARSVGAHASRTYFAQMGVVLYYMGAVPFCLFSKISKTTATLLLLFSAFAAADGFVRIADMIPLKSFGSVLPGLVIGFLIIPLFALVSVLEGRLRILIRTI